MPRMKDDERRFLESADKLTSQGKPVDAATAAKSAKVNLRRAQHFSRKLNLPSAQKTVTKATPKKEQDDANLQGREQARVDDSGVGRADDQAGPQ